MKRDPVVYLLTSGDGSDGDEWIVHSIHKTREGAQVAKEEYEQPIPAGTAGRTYVRYANIEEWALLP